MKYRLQLALVLLSSSMLASMVAAAWWPASTVAASTGPIQRKIVNELTPVLVDQLKAANISEWPL
jgi:Flp pilus assembly protein CpaB